MGFLFSKKKKDNGEHYAEDDVKKKKGRVTEHDKAVLDLKTQRDKLKAYQKRMTAVVEKEKETARQLLKAGQKDKALLVLKKKKRQEQLLAQSEAQLDNISQMIDSVEFAQMEKDVFDKLKSGNEVLTALNKEMSIDKIDALMEETEEAIAVQREIEQALSGYLTTEDDQDIEEELAALDELDEADLEAKLPDAPKHKAVADEDEEEEAPKKVSSKKADSEDYMKAGKTFCIIVVPPYNIKKVYFWGKADSDDKLTAYTNKGSKTIKITKGEFDDKVEDDNWGIEAAILVYKASSTSTNRTVQFETKPEKDSTIPDPTVNLHEWYDLTKYLVKDDSLAVGIIVLIVLAILVFIGLVILIVWCCTCRGDSGRSSADQSMETAIA